MSVSLVREVGKQKAQLRKQQFRSRTHSGVMVDILASEKPSELVRGELWTIVHHNTTGVSKLVEDTLHPLDEDTLEDVSF